MNIVILMGSPRLCGNTAELCKPFMDELKENGAKVRYVTYWMEYEYELKEHGFSGDEDYILKLTTMPFEEMFQISTMPEDEFDVHAGAFETATMREIYPESIREDELMELRPTFLRGDQIKKWCQGNVEDKNLIPNGYVGAPASSQYIKTRLKEADRRIAKDISGLV